jgi:hypothetical protein
LPFPETDVADSPISSQVEKVLLREGITHLAMMGYLVDMLVIGGDSAVLLAPVLEKIDAVVDVIYGGKLGVKSEYSAIVSYFLHMQRLSI